MSEEQDRRWHRRRSSVLAGAVVFGDPATTVPCSVQNMSASGAQLTFTTIIDLPTRFRLEVPQLDLKVEAQLAWSRGDNHGVRLLWPQRLPRS